jgi:hypothetical protein
MTLSLGRCISGIASVMRFLAASQTALAIPSSRAPAPAQDPPPESPAVTSNVFINIEVHIAR